MTNAAIAFYPDAFEISAQLMGRQSAGEGFLRGFIRHADVDRFYFWNAADEPADKTQGLVQAIEPTDKPANWFARHELHRAAEPGCLFSSAPATAANAWSRRLIGPSRYSLCGLTHTTASPSVMDAIASLLLSPVEPWDSLICTSKAVQDSVMTQLRDVFEFLKERFGSEIKPPRLRLDTIPLGINTADYRRSEAHRAHWRTELGIGEEDIAVLYVGRFSAHAKMNPLPMALALERAARATGRRLHWVMVGWGASAYLHQSFTENAFRYAPSVTGHVLDGRRPDVRFPIWSAGDIFLSLSDNIQETFGLTPVEAMAASLPCVVSDWDGYRDTVRHGVDGFRAPTVQPAPGMGGDIAFAHAVGALSYDRYVGQASMFAAVDIAAATDHLTALIDNADLRARMGEAARQHAETAFDWKSIIPRYQALWAELAAIRTAAPAKPAGKLNPWRPDPFTLYAGYPSRPFDPAMTVHPAEGATPAVAAAMLDDPTMSYAAPVLPSKDEAAAIIHRLQTQGPATAAQLVAEFPAVRAGPLERGILWMAKVGLVRLAPTPEVRAP